MKLLDLLFWKLGETVDALFIYSYQVSDKHLLFWLLEIILAS